MRTRARMVWRVIVRNNVMRKYIRKHVEEEEGEDVKPSRDKFRFSRSEENSNFAAKHSSTQIQISRQCTHIHCTYIQTT